MSSLARINLICFVLCTWFTVVSAQTTNGPWKMAGTKKANAPTVEETSTPKQTVTWRNPAVACSLLDGFGLKTRGWKNDPSKPSEYWCSAPYTPVHKEISNFVLCLAYYVDGTRDAARQLKIVMSVTDPRAIEMGHTALALASTELSKASLGTILPKDVLEALLAGETGKWKLGPNEIEIQREDYVKGWGYDLKLLIR